MQRHQLDHMQTICTLLQITTPTSHHSIFYRPGAVPEAQPTVSKHWIPNCLTTCEDWTNKRFICLVHAYSLSIVSQRLPLNATLAIFAFTAFKLLNALQADSDYNSNSSRYWRQIISLFIYLFIISLFKFKRVTKRFGRQINQFSEIVWKSRR